MNKKNIVKWIGRILMVLAFALIVKKIYGYKDSLVRSLDGKIIVIMIGSAILYALLIYTLPMIYKVLLQITTGKKFTHTKIAAIYCKSALYKYLPGNVMQYVGRNQLAVTDNLSHFDVATATLLDISTTVVACLLGTVLFSIHYAMEYLQKTSVNLRLVVQIVGILCILFILAFFVLYKYKKNTLKKYFEKYKHFVSLKNVRTYVILVLYNLVVFVLFGILFLWILASVGGHLGYSHWPVAIGLYCFSYLLGYITPGVPGGIGIREAVLGYFFAGWLDEGLIITGALIYRIMTIIGDILAYFISVMMVAYKKKAKTSD
ncbi:hypothetical protein LQZ18_04630 [Lachnospiraceae bacterium ZAX-1]